MFFIFPITYCSAVNKIYIYWYRLRQLRVRNDSCAVHEDFQNAIKVCYNEYSEDIEDKEPFLLGSREKTSAEA